MKCESINNPLSTSASQVESNSLQIGPFIICTERLVCCLALSCFRLEDGFYDILGWYIHHLIFFSLEDAGDHDGGPGEHGGQHGAQTLPGQPGARAPGHAAARPGPREPPDHAHRLERQQTRPLRALDAQWGKWAVSENQWNKEIINSQNCQNIKYFIWSTNSLFFSCVFHFLWRLQAKRDMSPAPVRCDGPCTVSTNKLITISIWQWFFCKPWFRVLWIIDKVWYLNLIEVMQQACARPGLGQCHEWLPFICKYPYNSYNTLVDGCSKCINDDGFRTLKANNIWRVS